MVFLAMIALVRAICANATSRSARAIHSSSDAARFSIRRRARPSTVSARAACACWAFDLGLLDGDVERDQHRARVNDLPGHEHDAVDGAGKLVAQGDRAQRQDRPDRRRRLPVFAFRRDGCRHRLHGLGLIRRGRVGFFYRGVLPGGEATPGREDRHEQQSRIQSNDYDS